MDGTKTGSTSDSESSKLKMGYKQAVATCHLPHKPGQSSSFVKCCCSVRSCSSMQIKYFKGQRGMIVILLVISSGIPGVQSALSVVQQNIQSSALVCSNDSRRIC